MNSILIKLGMYGIAVFVIWWIAEVLDVGLRDPRFFDGWILFAGMAVQIVHHMRYKLAPYISLRETSWREMHIFFGYVVAAVFAVHTSFGLPDSVFEWTLWSLFVGVVCSGLAGSYLIRTVPAKLEQRPKTFEFSELAVHRSDLAKRVETLVVGAENTPELESLWTLYATRLRQYFSAPRNVQAHLTGSEKPLKTLLHHIESCEHSDQGATPTIFESLKALVQQKNELDYVFAHLGLLRTWTFVHVPLTYALIVAALAHVAMMYAFSSGVP